MRFLHVQAQPPVLRKMKKNILKMVLMSGVVVVAFSSCDHLAVSLRHYGSSISCQPVVVARQPVVVHHEPAPQHVVVHHNPAPKPQPVVQHKPAAKPQPVVQHNKPAAKPQPVVQHNKPAAKPQPVVQNNKPAARPMAGKEQKPQAMAHNNRR